MLQISSILVIEVSCGEYGCHVDRMVSAVENGKNQKWNDYAVKELTLEEMEIELLNTGGVEKHNYKYGSTGFQQFMVLLKRMTLQTLRNRVSYIMQPHQLKVTVTGNRHQIKIIFYLQDYLRLRTGLHLFLGIIVAALFNRMGQDASKTIFNFGFCFACAIVMLYTPMMPILLACEYFLFFWHHIYLDHVFLRVFFNF